MANFLMTSLPRFIYSESSNHQQVKLQGAINIMRCSQGSIAICTTGPVKVSLRSLIDLCNPFPLFNQGLQQRKYVLVAANRYQFPQNFIFHSSFVYLPHSCCLITVGRIQMIVIRLWYLSLNNHMKITIHVLQYSIALQIQTFNSIFQYFNI